MKLTELMQGKVPKPEYEGWVTNDDFVFAINLTPGEGQTKETEYGVVQMGIEGLDAQMNPITVDKPTSVPGSPRRGQETSVLLL